MLISLIINKARIVLHTGQDNIYNSTMSCFRGLEQNAIYDATCVRNTSDEVGIIAVRRLFYGAQPNDKRCLTTDGAAKCCIYTPGEDCFFPNKPQELPADVISGCSGQRNCNVQGKKKRTSTSCPLPNQFSDSFFTTYGLMEYECINGKIRSDEC